MLKLVIGNKAYSTWSFRMALLFRALDILHDEIFIPLYIDGSKEEIAKYSPSGLVPVLIDGAFTVWDSTAIVEYLYEKFPGKSVYPKGLEARTIARSIMAEQHSGFTAALNRFCKFNLTKIFEKPALPEAVEKEIDYLANQVDAVQSRFGTKGKFLFGDFSAADAVYGVTFSRLPTYSIDPPKPIKAYCDLVFNHPIFQGLVEEARKEKWVLERSEQDFPIRVDFRPWLKKKA